MHHVVLMEETDGVGDLDQQPNDFFAAGVVRAQPVAQARAFDVFLDNVGPVVFLLHVVDGDQAANVSAGRRSELPRTNCAIVLAGCEEFPFGDFESHEAVEFRVVSQKDASVRSASQKLADLVAPQLVSVGRRLGLPTSPARQPTSGPVRVRQDRAKSSAIANCEVGIAN
jgi:hypothetical protein